MMKAGNSWIIFVNVTFGQVLVQSLILNASSRPLGISHVSRFVCAELGDIAIL